MLFDRINSMKRRTALFTTLFLIFITRPVFSLGGTVDYTPAFSLNPVNEGIELTTGVLLSGTALVFDKLVPIKENHYDPADWKIDDIPSMDYFFMQDYSKPLHIVGTGTMLLSLFTPAMFAALPSEEWLTVGTMYAETMLIANGIKEWLKLIVYRARPYMYFDGYPQDKVDEGDWNCSFPSGHTTMAFTGAAFTTMLFCQYFPESKWKYAVAGTSFGIAALTGALRIASGNHFVSDVITGAIIGTVCGIAVPYFHTKQFYSKFEKHKNPDLNVSPMGINLSFRF